MSYKYFMMDERLKKINSLLSEYSTGRFDRQLVLSEKLDETDAIINGINMLGQELNAITISRNYFTNIFNTVSDMVFVLNSRGVIENVNNSGEAQLGYEKYSLHGKCFNMLHQSPHSFFHYIRGELCNRDNLVISDSFLSNKEGGQLPVRIHASHFNDAHRKKMILLTASDTSFQAEAEKLIIRAIIDTQEKERQRLAKDLHDSLTQQLSAIKFYISSINSNTKQKEGQRILQKSKEGLSEVITDMRNICFNLMPRTLEEFGLVKAVEEFCSHYSCQQNPRFIIIKNMKLPVLTAELSVDLYRVVQELISNAVRHGNAGKIRVSFISNDKSISLIIKDNGHGYDMAMPAQGMGLKNIQSRVKSHNGQLYLQSTPDRGTRCKIIIPFTI